MTPPHPLWHQAIRRFPHAMTPTTSSSSNPACPSKDISGFLWDFRCHSKSWGVARLENVLAIVTTAILQEEKKKKRRKEKKSLYYIFIQPLFISPGQLQRKQAGVMIILLFFFFLKLTKVNFVFCSNPVRQHITCKVNFEKKQTNTIFIL